MMRPIAAYDTECYPNFWLLKFRMRDTGVIISFSLRECQVFTPEQCASIRRMFDLFCTISFNGNYYDVPMIAGALNGFTPHMLKQLNDAIIVEKKKPWELGLPEWKPADHIDVMEVAPGHGSQKQYAGRIHSKTMQDLPYEPDEVLTEEQITHVDAYCGNDLDVLLGIFNELKPQIDQRIRLGQRYGIDLRSKSDAQIAETILRNRCERALGRKIYKPEVHIGVQFPYKPPSFLTFAMPQLIAAFDLVKASMFRINMKGQIEMPEQLEGLTINIGGSTYKMGIGGLHSSESSITHRSDEHYVLRDNDVASYYPTLMLNSGEYPPALGVAFIQEFEGIKTERLHAKALAKKLPKGTPEQITASQDDAGGKIQINGTFGKTGSPYSILFAPTMLIQTTVTGQLSLLMLIEWMELSGIPVVSANTDGIVTRVPRHLVDHATAIIHEWERRTGLEMETVEYLALHSRDVNSYFAIKPDGDVKRKGAYAPTGWQKNPEAEICSDAVADFLAKGTPIVDSIVACRDIRKFVCVRRVNGGAIKLWGEGPGRKTLVRDMVERLERFGWKKRGRMWFKPFTSELINSVGGGTGAPVPGYETEYTASEAYAMCFDVQRKEYLGKVVRWYYSTQAPGHIEYATNGNLVSNSEGAKPCMTLPDELPTDIDYAWYVKSAQDILTEIGYTA